MTLRRRLRQAGPRPPRELQLPARGLQLQAPPLLCALGSGPPMHLSCPLGGCTWVTGNQFPLRVFQVGRQRGQASAWSQSAGPWATSPTAPPCPEGLLPSPAAASSRSWLESSSSSRAAPPHCRISGQQHLRVSCDKTQAKGPSGCLGQG